VPSLLLSPDKSLALTRMMPPVREIPALVSVESSTQREFSSVTGLPATHTFHGVSQPEPSAVQANS
jgi:hypothetical protein